GSRVIKKPGWGVAYSTLTFCSRRTDRSASGMPPSSGPVVVNSEPSSSSPVMSPLVLSTLIDSTLPSRTSSMKSEYEISSPPPVRRRLDDKTMARVSASRAQSPHLGMPDSLERSEPPRWSRGGGGGGGGRPSGLIPPGYGSAGANRGQV